jgi:hypothetical protein
LLKCFILTFSSFVQEDLNRGKANWEHLDEDLHVLIQCEDYENRAGVKLERAKEEILKLLKPAVKQNVFVREEKTRSNVFVSFRLKVKTI